MANTTPGLLQRFARAAAANYNRQERLTAVARQALPWKGFDRHQLQPFLDRLVVSYKPDRGTPGTAGQTTGQLHNETAYGLIKFVAAGPSAVVVRKPLGTGASGWPKTRKHLESVRDDALRTALLARWDRVGGKQAEFVETAKTEGVLLNGRRQRVRRVRVKEEQRVIPIRDSEGRLYKGYLPGGNEFADVWQLRDESWKLVVVPRFDANQPGFDIEQFRPVDKSGRRDPTAKRLMRLHIDDMGALGAGPEHRIVRVRKTSGDLVWLDDHNEANVVARITESRRRRREGLDHEDIKEHNYSARQLKQQGFRIVRVDEIGRVRDPGPPAP